MKRSFLVCSLLLIVQSALAHKGTTSIPVSKAKLGCNPMNAQMLVNPETKIPYAEIGGYCGPFGEFDDAVELSMFSVIDNLVMYEDTVCGKIEVVGNTWFVPKRKECFFTINGREVQINIFKYAGDGDLVFTYPVIGQYGWERSIFLDNEMRPYILYTNRYGESEPQKFSSKHLTYKDGEIYYKGRPCGRLEGDSLVKHERFNRYKDNCKLYQNGANVYLVPSAPWKHDQL